MIQPKISVVTVCYNAVNDIEKTILSVADNDLDAVIKDMGKCIRWEWWEGRNDEWQLAKVLRVAKKLMAA